MNKLVTMVAVATLALLPAIASAGNEKADIKVMTQNQYLGADLAPVIGAGSPGEYAAAIAEAIVSIAQNNAPERIAALSQTITDRQPHLVALQEVYEFDCIGEAFPGACGLFPGAFNDHLALTEAALGDDYVTVAVLKNLDIPGLPVVIPEINGLDPVFYVTVKDRDVILARSDVDANVAPLFCQRPAAESHGCHYNDVAPITVLGQDILIERGFVAVDAVVDGNNYRLVNTHLEIRQLGDSVLSTLLQPAQMTELTATVAANPMPPGSRLIIAGDINSAPTDGPMAPFNVPTAYQQATFGINAFGQPNGLGPMIDSWTLRPGNSDGFTCCEAANLLNDPSEHDRRIDVVMVKDMPSSVKANVLDAEVDDKTASGLWPSDHASVIAEISWD